MWYLICIVAGAIAGAVGAVIYYRRNVVEVEAALVEAVNARKTAEAMVDDLKKKLGG